MGRKIKKLAIKYKIYIKYVISGCTGALVNLSTLFILTEFAHIYYLVSVVIAFFVSLAVSFNLQKRWTFRDNNKKVFKQVLIYFIIAGTDLLINIYLLYFLVEKLGIWYMMAQVMVYGSLSVLSFILYKFLVFRKEKKMNKKKKILAATGIFPPDIGGPATYVDTLLKELPKHGLDVGVVTYTDTRAARNARQDGNVFKINRNQNILLRYFQYFLQVWKLISWADVVYIQDPISSGIPASLACRLRGKKYYLKIVGDYAWEQGRQKYGVKANLDDFQTKKYGFRVELLRFLEYWVARGAKKIITPSNYLKNIVLRWKVPEKNIKVICNSVRKAEVIEEKEVLRKELGISGDVIISVGRLVPWKGFDLLIDIMPELLKVNKNFKLYIVGDGPEFENYELRIKNYELSNNVKLLGKLEQKKLWQYMKASDLFVLNTGYEGLPHIIIEAMYLGLPVITTDAGGNVEVVKPGENGLLVEYNNKEQIKRAILETWKNRDARQEMIKNGKKNLEKFSVKNMIYGLVQIL
ncbi:glycosyltransferase [Candidatus Parcubacteria bacterium]|nr:glycosyltransferase [Candidatus Parcubacteria bacterium]